MPEDKALESQIVKSLLADRRASRRWSIIRTCLWVFIILFIFGMLYHAQKPPASQMGSTGYVSLMRLNGIIMPGSRFSAEKVVPRLTAAFADKQSHGVVLVINSPGGSPVQAGIIHDRINFLKQKYHKKVLVLGQDALASGAYLVATAADEIYVHKDTLTGSIGVIMSGFGFTDAMKKIGVTRRVYTAGKDKDRLDPFRPETPGDIKKFKTMLDEVHKNFIDDVLEGRHGRLHGKPDVLFSGDFWTGTHAVSLGLADGTGNLWTLLQTQFGVQHYKDYSLKPTFFEELVKGVETKLNFSLENNHVSLHEVMY